jgi:hypothetical protein
MVLTDKMVTIRGNAVPEHASAPSGRRELQQLRAGLWLALEEAQRCRNPEHLWRILSRLPTWHHGVAFPFYYLYYSAVVRLLLAFVAMVDAPFHGSLPQTLPRASTSRALFFCSLVSSAAPTSSRDGRRLHLTPVYQRNRHIFPD